MEISNNGVELVVSFEICHLKAYKCPAGVWTIGYGHTQGVREGDILPSTEQAKQILKDDLRKYSEYVNNYVTQKVIGFALTQNQFDALTSFAYNCGPQSLKTLVSNRNAATVAEKLLDYDKAGGKFLPELVRRRQAEQKLFLA